jgi:hypothetical protein
VILDQEIAQIDPATREKLVVLSLFLLLQRNEDHVEVGIGLRQGCFHDLSFPIETDACKLSNIELPGQPGDRLDLYRNVSALGT